MTTDRRYFALAAVLVAAAACRDELCEERPYVAFAVRVNADTLRDERGVQLPEVEVACTVAVLFQPDTALELECPTSSTTSARPLIDMNAVEAQDVAGVGLLPGAEVLLSVFGRRAGVRDLWLVAIRDRTGRLLLAATNTGLLPGELPPEDPSAGYAPDASFLAPLRLAPVTGVCEPVPFDVGLLERRGVSVSVGAGPARRIWDGGYGDVGASEVFEVRVLAASVISAGCDDCEGAFYNVYALRR